LKNEQLLTYGVVIIMRTYKAISRLLIIAIVVSTAKNAPAIQNRNVRNPVGSPTKPVSSRQSSQHRVTGDYMPTGNMIVTGNVGGGKHFRGIVPYNAASNFAGNTNTSTVDSFLRRSAGSESYGDYTGNLRPYYSQTRTVTGFYPGGTRVYTPPTQARRISGLRSASDVIRLENTVPKRYLSNTTINVRPMSLTLDQIDNLVIDDLQKDEKTKRISEQQYQQKLKQTSEQLDTLALESKILDLKIKGKDAEAAQLEKLLEQKKQAKQLPEKPTETKAKEPKPGFYERVKQQIDKFNKDTQAKKDVEKETDAQKQQTYNDSLQNISDKIELSTTGKTRTDQAQDTGDDQSSKFKKLAETYAARAAVAEYGSYDAYVDAKFEKYMKAAEDYMHQGKYYIAASTYDLAGAFKPDNVIFRIGEAHALFAAGEYMSSAFSLARAIEAWPEFVNIKVDFEQIFGEDNKDDFDDRLIDLEKWLDISNAGELNFLAAYVYYHKGNITKAKKYIALAAEKMPDSKAVTILKNAIINQR